MSKKRIYTILVLSGVIMAMTVQPVQAYSRSWKKKYHHREKVFGKHRHYSHYPHSYGHISFRLPRGFISISLGGEKYHYRDGVYYRKAHHGYVVTPPPIGACIDHLPHGYAKIYINGIPYYTYDETYYEHTPEGYVVIEKPRTKYVKRGRAAKKHKNEYYEASFEINIPNKHGGYTTVIIQRSGDGFTGPQGEYYEEFPRVDKLKVFYGS